MTSIQRVDSDAPAARRVKANGGQNSRAAAHLPSPDWQPGQSVPEGFHPALGARRGVLSLGVAMLAVSHGASTAVGLLGLVGSVGTADGGSTSSGAKQDPSSPSLYLLTPVVGPFLAAKVGGCGAICIVDGAVQTAGLGLIVFGLLAREPVLVRNRLALSVAPVRLGPNGQCVALFGRF